MLTGMVGTTYDTSPWKGWKWEKNTNNQALLDTLGFSLNVFLDYNVGSDDIYN